MWVGSIYKLMKLNTPDTINCYLMCQKQVGIIFVSGVKKQ